jgi:hypothetical protein
MRGTTTGDDLFPSVCENMDEAELSRTDIQMVTAWLQA